MFSNGPIRPFGLFGKNLPSSEASLPPIPARFSKEAKFSDSSLVTDGVCSNPVNVTSHQVNLASQRMHL